MGKGISCKIYELCGRDCTHCATEEAKKKAKKMQICNWIVADRSFITGIKISNFCQNCGQALDTEITKEQDT